MTRGNDYDVPFDYRHFKKLAEKGISFSMKDTFRQIYQANIWKNPGSVSGNGSTLIQTAEIAKHLPGIIKKYNIKTMLDLPCGDFNWMRSIDLEIDRYTGADIVEEIITKNRQTYGNEKYRFLVLDITRGDLPKTDLIFCRDCLVHLSYDDIFRAFRNIKRCGIAYILTTTFTGFSMNHDIVSGDWRPLGLESTPFDLPGPIESIDEKCTEGGGKFADKSLGLWHVKDLAD